MNSRSTSVSTVCELIDDANRAAAADLIARTFSRDEPLAATVGQTADEFRAMLAMFLPAA